MAPSVLTIGIPANSDIVPLGARDSLQKSLNDMEADIKASPYDWEVFYLTPQMPFELCTTKLREKKWDVVMLGMGLRRTESLTPFFERIVNTIHEELPGAKFAFNETLDKTREAVDRVLATNEKS